MAMGAIDFALEKGIDIPTELSIAGFDDVEGAAKWKIPLTTVAVPKRFIGKSAGRLLWARLEDKESPVHRVDVGTNLIIRNSSTSPKARGKVKNRG
jgi:DNA-binding LacI/PurR family transcriptional regulator